MEDAKIEDGKKQKIYSVTKLYYSNPKIQEAIVRFARDREVVPSYMMESFGKRPDTINYANDIMTLVNKGATSFHASEELWNDPLKLSTDMKQDEVAELRKSWDLLIDIDSQYLDCSKIAAKLIIKELEHHGIKNYGLKYSGNKGFHIIIPGRAFPSEFNGFKTSRMFPDWPKAIVEYLISSIRKEYYSEVGKIFSYKDVEKRTGKLSAKAQVKNIYCTNCERKAALGVIVKLKCSRCHTEIERKNYKPKGKLKCPDLACPGELELVNEKDYYYCENCSQENKNIPLNTENNSEYFKELRGEDAEEFGKLDLVLVSPRHLFRIPYSLHEKTALASIVISKDKLDSFSPRDASPLSIINDKILDFIPVIKPDEAKKLLGSALAWKSSQNAREKKEEKAKNERAYEEINFSGITEDVFPEPIKKLLKGGFEDGRKRGLFIMLTFLKSLNFQPDYISAKAKEWNSTNKPPLKESYIKSQIEWHLKQKRKILPPNYSNESFYHDLNLLDVKPDAKNPIVEVVRKLKRNK